MFKKHLFLLVHISSIFQVIGDEIKPLGGEIKPLGGEIKPYKNLFWFIQITDVHISIVQDPTRIEDFKTFCSQSLDVFKPLAVICSGDLTEAKEIAHHQNEKEWRIYIEAVQNRKPHDVPWMDIRGNHDNFNVLNRQSGQNYFSNYSESGRKNDLRSYRRTISRSGTTFNFVALDATLEIGLNYPFNYAGHLDQQEQNILRNITQNLTKNDVNIFFGHYPTSVVTEKSFIRNLLSKCMVYLCGHLHDNFKIHQMYTFHNERDLELELDDWKFNRAFRVLAVDNGRLSFTDVRHNDWPVILPTWPKAYDFILPGKEPPVDQDLGAFIKVLVFSPRQLSIKSVEVSIDGNRNRQMNVQNNGPLYMAPWKSNNYKNGLHKMVITVTDKEDNVKTHEQYFTLNPSEAVLFRKWYSSFILESSFNTVFQSLFFVTLACNLLIPITLRLVYFSAQRNALSSSSLAWLRTTMGCWLFRKLFLVAICDRMFLPLLSYILYMAVGPWMVGSLVEGATGFVFAWGVVVDGKFVPSQIPFAFYWVHFSLMHPIAVLIYGHILDVKRFKMESEIYLEKYHKKPRYKILPKLHWSCALLSLLFAIVLTVYLSLAVWREYGVIGIFFGPFRTWSLIFYAILAVVAWRMPAEKCTEKTNVIFTSDIHYNYDETVFEELNQIN